ncbi:Rho termination factor N-terminal domain-containing protein [filamentous cyanobacterium LEGE 07170]|nr:Rho termination factor N-terminal domain-containing protein [filamentous cyanobacterium LEGE 07170]
MAKAELQKAIAEERSSDRSSDKSAEDADGLHSQTRDELYETAKDMEISGRSTMKKDELVEAIQQEEGA